MQLLKYWPLIWRAVWMRSCHYWSGSVDASLLFWWMCTAETHSKLMSPSFGPYVESSSHFVHCCHRSSTPTQNKKKKEKIKQREKNEMYIKLHKNSSATKTGWFIEYVRIQSIECVFVYFCPKFILSNFFNNYILELKNVCHTHVTVAFISFFFLSILIESSLQCVPLLWHNTQYSIKSPPPPASICGCKDRHTFQCLSCSKNRK